MVMSALSAPIYAKSLIDAVLRRKSRFVVTPKGDSASPDTLLRHLPHPPVFILRLRRLARRVLRTSATPTRRCVTWAVLALADHRRADRRLARHAAPEKNARRQRAAGTGTAQAGPHSRRRGTPAPTTATAAASRRVRQRQTSRPWGT